MTLYKEQRLKLANMSDESRKFIADNEARLKTKRMLMDFCSGRLAGISLVFAILFCEGALAQTKPKAVVMSPPTDGGVAMPKIDGGARQDPRNWPSTLQYLVRGELHCTSTVIGAQVIITAAHCLEQNAEISVDLGRDGKRPLECEFHKQFDSRTLFADVALCKTRVAFPIPPGGFETLNFGSALMRDAWLFLLGYGCRDVRRPERMRGQLYGGLSQVELNCRRGPGDHVRIQNGVVVCPGDSGGAAYLGKESGPRSVVGVNSGYQPLTRESFITPIAGVAEFIRNWAYKEKLAICGLPPDRQACRPAFAQRQSR